MGTFKSILNTFNDDDTDEDTDNVVDDNEFQPTYKVSDFEMAWVDLSPNVMVDLMVGIEVCITNMLASME